MLVTSAALLTACGNEPSGPGSKGSRDAADPPPTRVIATTADGETVEFTEFTIACRLSEHEQPPAQIVVALAGFGDDAERPRKPTGPAMMINAADSLEGTTVALPYSENGEEKNLISVLVTEVGGQLDLSTRTELSTGEIEVVSASCEPTPRLEMRIDAVLESELSDNTVTVEGYVAVQ